MTEHSWRHFSVAMALAVCAAISASPPAWSQDDGTAVVAPTPHSMSMPTDGPTHGNAGTPGRTAVPTLPGQDAFGAIQEIVRILEADPTTDWSKVNLEALRQHLIDMNEVTLHAAAAPERIPGGLRITVTGHGRTIIAIRRMVTGQAMQIDRTHFNGWNARVEKLPDGVILTVTATVPKEIAHIRGLGFIGIMASGNHHQPHHLAMARGEMKP